MSFDLKSTNGSTFRFSGTGWGFYLNIAEKFGWRPEGTKKPKGYGLLNKWSGVYDSNEGQFVSPSDARNLARSLSAAVLSPDIEAVADEIASQIEEAVKQALGGSLPSGYSVQRDIDKEYIKSFISFCESGGFYIE